MSFGRGLLKGGKIPQTELTLRRMQNFARRDVQPCRKSHVFIRWIKRVSCVSRNYNTVITQLKKWLIRWTIEKVIWMLSRVALWTQWWNRELTLKCKLKKAMWNLWKTHLALALVKGIREPHEVKKNSFDLGGNRTHDLRIRSTVTLPIELRGRDRESRDDLGGVVIWFPLLGLTPSGSFMGFT